MKWLPGNRGRSHRSAGQYARAAERALRLRTLIALGLLAVVTELVGRSFGPHDKRFLGWDALLLMCMLAISRYVLPLLERRNRGATAEEHVGGLLDQLAGWRVIHDASTGHGNVDHVIIGPAGVFTVETKSHPGPVRVARVHGATLRQAQAQRRRVEGITALKVEPLLVYSSAWIDRPMARRRGVRVVPARLLLVYLTGRRRVLSPEQVELAYHLLAAALTEQQLRTRLRGRAGAFSRL
ncbi:MAG TPA: nuclease-related domain-containing protein [Solirubrobacteraceae bacterium]|nr:nuclease-related domain-containing protein [Solirubrobacteraceae bacterium]